jgi:arylsulfatase A-like enzyme
VRSEYFDAVFLEKTREPVGQFGHVYSKASARPDPESYPDGIGTFATMYRTDRHKLVVYHGHNLGELYDLDEDPWEFDNLWDDPAHEKLKSELIFASFDSHVMLTTDVGSRRISPM